MILPSAKLDAFLATSYARGAHETKNLKLPYLWSQKWGPRFFAKTTNRNDFSEILRYLSFETRAERSQRLRTDKFLMISIVWMSEWMSRVICNKG